MRLRAPYGPLRVLLLSLALVLGCLGSDDDNPGQPPGCETCCETCGGVGCVDLQSDPAHCGDCGVACDPGAVCSLGGCAASCDPSLTQCGAACVDIAGDPASCGGCGVSCGAGGTCEASACVCAGGADTQTDPNNCGACGNVCAPGQSCVDGACTCGNATVSFAMDVQPILAASCATNGCHGGVAAQGGLNLSAGQAYQELVGVAAEQCNDGRQRVLPGDPSQSYLIDKILGVDMCAGTQMPKQTDLPAAQTEILSSWICAGAPNN